MLSDAPYVSLRTYRRSGVAVDTPVWIGGTGSTLYVFSAADAGKVKRIRNNPAVQMATCDVRGKLRGEWSNGSATLMTDDAEVTQALAALRQKYGWQMWLADTGAKLTGRFSKRAYIRIDMDGG